MSSDGWGFNRWEKEKNKSESVRAEFDLCSHHQSFSMAGLNLLSPKLKQTVNRCYTKAANVLHYVHTWNQKPPVLSRVQLTRDRKRVPERMSQVEGHSVRVSGISLWEKHHRRAAKHMQAEQGWEQQVHLCERKSFYHIIVLVEIIHIKKWSQSVRSSPHCVLISENFKIAYFGIWEKDLEWNDVIKAFCWLSDMVQMFTLAKMAQRWYCFAKS